MPYRANPFLERMSERTTSDQEFVRLFSPKILERLAEDAFEGGVHIFRSPPGAGKTTLLRAFTPTALRAFWNARHVQEIEEAYQVLVAREVLHQQDGPQLLGILLSCASGYADLPPGATIAQEGLFRALLDCRVVLRSLRSLASLLGLASTEQLSAIRLDYDDLGKDLKSIPTTSSIVDLVHWAEQRERGVYAQLDSVTSNNSTNVPTHVRFESDLWLQAVRFIAHGKVVAPKRLLMIDDLHKLRRKQRSLVIEEFTESRPVIPVWLAERSIALGEELLSQGVRQGRDLREYALEEIWGAGRGQYQFAAFAQNILDRRLDVQTVIPHGAFSQYLRSSLEMDDSHAEVVEGINTVHGAIQRYSTNPRYAEWVANSERVSAEETVDSLLRLYVARILLTRDELKRQLTLELAPLSTADFEERDSSQVHAAAEIFMHDELRIPYYFGIEKLCTMATSNVEELLALAAALYEGLRAKQVLRRPELILSPYEQEKVLKDVAKRKRDFIPKNHVEGTRAQRLLDAIGAYCRDRTFLPNAPYAPGVTGVRLSQAELTRLNSDAEPGLNQRVVLRRVFAECVAENLLFTRPSAASTTRDSGTVFYLNRTMCAHYGLPLQTGGWQDVEIDDLIDWMERGRVPSRHKLLEFH
jgi:hypothetical protein